MKIKLKREVLYPSTSKPGVFYYEEGQEELWKSYTNIDDSEINTYKFSIGTWQELSRQNRGIKLLPIDEMDFISLGLDQDTGEPKPSAPPEGYLENTKENAEELEEKPPEDSKGAGIKYGKKISDDTYEEFEYIGAYSSYRDKSPIITEIEVDGEDGHFRSDIDNIAPGDTDGSAQEELSILESFPYLETGFKSNDPRIGNDDAKGYWILENADVKALGAADVFVQNTKKWGGKALEFLTYGIIEAPPDSDGNLGDAYLKFEWAPNLNEFTIFNKNGTYSDGYEWKWDGFAGEWVPGAIIITEPQLRRPENIYFGFPIISENKPDSYNILNQDGAESDEYNFPVFYPTDSDEYNNTTAPARVWFGINTFQTDKELGSFKLKYHVLEWGDEDIKLTNEQILNSEFFSLYSVDDDTFDKSQAKRLFQTIERSPLYLDEDGEMNLTEHTYTTPGVKNIKTILFRISSDGSILYETILLNTNIVINDAAQYKQDFNIFGAVEYSVLPLKSDEQELVIGGFSEKSKYVKSLKVVDRDDLYGSGDYLDKKYVDEFLPAVKNSLYGNSLGKVDLSTTRLFSKPYDISYFINSKATDILIDNKDCLVEINPSETDRNIIENTGNTNQKAILVGDYEVVKEAKRDLRKKDSMDVPKIETNRQNQAF